MSVIVQVAQSTLKAVIDLIYPPFCHICDHPLEDDSHICESCLQNFQMQEGAHEEFSVSGEIFINKAWALFEFDDAFQKLIHNLKYSGKRKSVLAVLDYYEEEITQLLRDVNYDWVLPVPLHPRKERERGYNQVADICGWLALRLGAHVNTWLVDRVKYTKTQTKLSAEERQKNMLEAFHVKATEEVKDSSILIVDDVITTGATANTLAQALRLAGAKKIDLISLSSPK